MNWEPWTGCKPYSDGCKFCYFYGPYAKRYGQNDIIKTDKYDWPVRKKENGEYNIKGGKILATCFATDFFLPEADKWRMDIWSMIKERQDITFLILTKRIDRFMTVLPTDWKEAFLSLLILPERLDYKYYILRRMLFEKKQHIGDCSITGRL